MQLMIKYIYTYTNDVVFDKNKQILAVLSLEKISEKAQQLEQMPTLI